MSTTTPILGVLEDSLDGFLAHEKKIRAILTQEEIRNLSAAVYSLLGATIPVKTATPDLLFSGVCALRQRIGELLRSKRHDAFLMCAIALRLYVKDLIA